MPGGQIKTFYSGAVVKNLENLLWNPSKRFRSDHDRHRCCCFRLWLSTAISPLATLSDEKLVLSRKFADQIRLIFVKQAGTSVKVWHIHKKMHGYVLG